MFALEPADPRHVEIEWIALGLGVAAAIAAWTFPLWQPFYAVECPLKELVGIPCALCGATRAVHAWACGRLFEAIAFNPLAAIAAGGATLYLPYAAFCVAARPMQRLRLTGLGAGASPAMRWSLRGALAASILLNWAYLIHTGR